MGVLSACCATYLSKYMGVDTLIVSIALLLLLLNIWVWFVSDIKKEIKPARDFVETKKMVLMKSNEIRVTLTI